MTGRRVTLDELRRYTVARSLFKPTTLGSAIRKLGFVQADPIRAPARAQDLTLRHRVVDYVAGDLERRYPRLAVEEVFFINYGFMPRPYQALIPRRPPVSTWTSAHDKQANAALVFIRERGVVNSRGLDEQLALGKIRNWFGGSSNATARLLDVMHYRGMLRVARRESGIRVYAARTAAQQAAEIASDNDRFDALVDIGVSKYAPLPAACLGTLVSLVCRGVPEWQRERGSALARAKRRLSHQDIEGVQWYWPADEAPVSVRWRIDDCVRLLTPFDPIVWERRRFELLWNWAYRFEAYTPAPRRTLGYYALPMLWRDQVIGWANLNVHNGTLQCNFGYASGAAPKSSAFRRELEDELSRIRAFLQVKQL